MRTVYYQPRDMDRPKRGDLMQSAIGTRRERTWFVLHAHPLPHGDHPVSGESCLRTRVWAERWWLLEFEMRMMLFRSAERNGGQVVHLFHRFPAKRKRTFEDFMRRAG